MDNYENERVDSLAWINSRAISTIYKLSNIINLSSNEISKYYPDFDKWIKSVIDNGISHNRDILFMEDDYANIIGYSVIKYHTKKICTLYVHPDFRRKGVGSALMTESLYRLDYEAHLTIIEKLYSETKPFFDKFKFTLDKRPSVEYINGQPELILRHYE